VRAITAGDVGPVLEIDAGGYSLLGSTCVLLAAPGKWKKLLGRGTTFSPVVVSQDGLSGAYTWNGNDFTTSGPWTLELQVHTQDGQTITSPPGYIYVFPRIA
jgi:hypothetical protein